MRIAGLICYNLIQLICAGADHVLNNTAVAIGGSMTMSCRDAVLNCSNQNTKTNTSLWRYRVPGSQRDINLSKKMISGRTEINATCSGQFDLTIRDVKYEDAGTYFCVTQLALYAAELIVLDSNPNCHASTNESDVIALRCTIAYRGNFAPTMKWRTDLGFEIPSTNTNPPNLPLTSVVKNSTISMLVKEATVQYSCDIYFESIPIIKSEGRMSATNVPDYRNTWKSPVMKTHFKNKEDIILPSADEHKSGYKKEGGNIPYSLLVTPSVVAIAVLVILLTVYIAKNCKEKKRKHYEDAHLGSDCYAEISQKGNASFGNVPLPLRDISLYHLDATSLSSKEMSNYPQRNRRHYEEDEIAAYSETRTIASVPVHFLGNRSMLSLNQVKSESYSLGRTNGHLQPSVDSAMPVYAEVHKPKVSNDKGHVPSSQRLSRSASDDANNDNKQLASSGPNKDKNIGADGTVYMQLGGSNHTAKESIPLPKKRTETAVYAMVDHTRRLPPPPPQE